jgi:putative effector of murein hydrolase LrgA (UPF0299 family)
MSRGVVVLLACLVVGVGLNVGFQHAITRIVGMLLLFAFIVLGVFLIADPKFLGREDDEVS